MEQKPNRGGNDDVGELGMGRRGLSRCGGIPIGEEFPLRGNAFRENRTATSPGRRSRNRAAGSSGRRFASQPALRQALPVPGGRRGTPKGGTSCPPACPSSVRTLPPPVDGVHELLGAMCDEVADAATVSLVVQSLCNEVASAAAESAHSSEIVGLGLAARYLPEIDDYLYVDIGVTGKDTPVRGRRYKTSRVEEYHRKKALSEETKRARKAARMRESYQRNPAKKREQVRACFAADPEKKRKQRRLTDKADIVGNQERSLRWYSQKKAEVNARKRQQRRRQRLAKHAVERKLTPALTAIRDRLRARLVLSARQAKEEDKAQRRAAGMRAETLAVLKAKHLLALHQVNASPPSDPLSHRQMSAFARDRRSDFVAATVSSIAADAAKCGAKVFYGNPRLNRVPIIKQNHRTRMHRNIKISVENAFISKEYLAQELTDVAGQLRGYFRAAKEAADKATAPSAVAGFLGGHFLAERYHVRSAEGPGFDHSTVTYAPLGDILADCPTKDRKVLGRVCDFRCCSLPKNWENRLLNGLRLFNEGIGYGYAAVQSALIDFEKCSDCRNSKQGSCGLDSCTDCLGLLRQVSVHSGKLRALLRTFYAARKLNEHMCQYDSCFAKGTWKGLCALVAYGKETSKQSLGPEYEGSRSDTIDVSKIKAQYAKQLRAFLAAEADHPVHVCFSCEQFYSKSLLREIAADVADGEKKPLFKRELRKVCKERGVPLPTSAFLVCKGCNEAMNKGNFHAKSVLNGFNVDDIPAELALNDYEKFLIQQAKPFFSVIRLQPLSSKNMFGNKCFAEASVGNAIHLPLPVQETVGHAVGTLPNADCFRILVEGYPTKKEIIWRSLVDLKKVISALQWLKGNNPLYADMEIVDVDSIEKQMLNAIVLCSEKAGAKSWGGSEQKGANPVPPAAPCLAADGHLLTQSERHPIEAHYSVVDVHSKQTKPGEDLARYRQLKVTGNIIPESEEDLDLACFPVLFPKGQYGKDHRRPLKVRGPEYYKYRLNHVDPRFRMDKTWMFHANYAKLNKQIGQGTFYATKTGHFAPDLNAGKWCKMATEKTGPLGQSLEAGLQKIRGTKEYWGPIASDLAAYDEQFGPCTFFVTLSCAENRWAELRKVMLLRNPSFAARKGMTNTQMCVADPVTFSEFFHRRWNAFFDKVLLDPEGPLGELEHWFWRLEYQSRGAPHIHMKLWVKGAPIAGQSPDPVVQRFIEKHISCALPDASTELGSVIHSSNRHRCTKSCKRRKKREGPNDMPRYYSYCRYGFPRKVMKQFKLNKVDDVLFSRRRRSKTGKKIYSLRRTRAETHVNDYTPAIAMFWDANTDTQYVGEPSRVLDQYVTSYVTKAEKTATEGLWEQLDQDKSVASRVRSLILMATQTRETGIFEVADNLLQHPLYGRSDAVVYVATGFPENRKRRPKPLGQLETLSPDSTDIFVDNMVETYYPKRPVCPPFPDMCLADLVSNYEHVTNKQYNELKREATKERYFACQDGKGYFRRRTRPVVVKSPFIAFNKPENRERYFHDLLQLYKPYRNEQELIGGKGTYAEAFKAAVDDLPAMQTADYRKQQTLKAKERIDEEDAKAAAAAEEARLAEERELLAQEGPLPAPAPLPSGAPTFVGEKSRYQADFMTKEGLEKRVAALNKDQLRIYESVLRGVEHNVEHRTGQCSCPDPNQLLLFVSGVAGVGKSFLIEVINEALTLRYKSPNSNTVIIGAPTGLASQNVNGRTLHKIFTLPVEHGMRTPVYQMFRKEAANEFHRKISGMRLLIIDEISMVSNLNLAFINRRLCDDATSEHYTCTAPFGGQNVLVFGDLLQLPPVGNDRDAGIFCFDTIVPQTVKAAFQSVPVRMNVFEDFAYDELTINMRQKDDRAFAELLNRIRLGLVSDADLAVLRERVLDVPLDAASTRELSIAKYVNEKFAASARPLIMVPNNGTAEALNRAFLDLGGLEPVTITAEDSGQRGKYSRSVKVGKLVKSLPTRDTAALETELTVAVGARVMLRKNLDVDAGLFNGAMGTVQAIRRNSTGYVSGIEVKFDLKEDVTLIERFQADYEVSAHVLVTRSQFPLSLAYALTVHKCQGVSLASVLCDLGDAVFCPAMSYVAMSRVTSLKGLHLLDFSPENVRCSQAVVDKYNELRTASNATRAADCKLPLITHFRASGNHFVARKKASKTVVTRDLDLFGTSAPPPPAPTASKRKLGPVSGVAAKKQAPSGAYFLPLRNTFRGVCENACFSNSLVQCLLSLDGFRNALSPRPAQGPAHALALLARHYSDRKTRLQNTAKLRESVDKWNPAGTVPAAQTFADGNQHDIQEFAAALFERLSPTLRSLFVFDLETTFTCTTCNHVTRQSEQSILLHGNRKVDATLDEAVSLRDERDKRCNGPSCSSLGTSSVTHTAVSTVTLQGDFLLVLLSPFDFVQGQGVRMHGKITDFAADDCKLDGKKLALVAAASHYGDTLLAGHYTAWIPCSAAGGGRLWTEVSDNTCRPTLAVPCSDSMYLLVFARA